MCIRDNGGTVPVIPVSVHHHVHDSAGVYRRSVCPVLDVYKRQACEHLLVECSKLGKTRIIADGKHGRIRNSVFCAPNVHAPGLIWNVVLSDFFSVIYDIAVRSRDSLILWRHRQHPGICCADILPCD